MTTKEILCFPSKPVQAPFRRPSSPLDIFLARYQLSCFLLFSYELQEDLLQNSMALLLDALPEVGALVVHGTEVCQDILPSTSTQEEEEA
jgi:hypothetical protein